MADSLKWWIEYHREDYQAVNKRLDMARNVILHGRIDAATRMLRMSAVHAVLSIQTQLERHERAFTAYYAGDTSLETAAGMTVYGNQKARWLHESLGTFDFEAVVEIIRDGNIAGALSEFDEHFTGLSYTKAAFTLAMCGMYECMCIDTNVRQTTDLDLPDRNDMSLVGFTAQDYMSVCEDIQENTGFTDMRPFTLQWAMYDYSREEHARHMPFWTEVFPNI